MAKGKVGVVGLGIMGGAFAKNLVAAGWRVVGYDIDPARRRTMARAGVEIAPDVRTLAAAVGTIITSLPKPTALGPELVVDREGRGLDDHARTHAGADDGRYRRVERGGLRQAGDDRADRGRQ